MLTHTRRGIILYLNKIIYNYCYILCQTGTRARKMIMIPSHACSCNLFINNLFIDGETKRGS